MSKPLLTADPVYQKIQQYYNENGSKINIKELFDSDPKRFEKFSLTLKTPNDGDILLVSFHKHNMKDQMSYKSSIMKIKKYSIRISQKIA
jgi:glucose-6-phosphate isomerase